MNKVFDLNNPVWQFIGKIVDATVLHFCWLICCIPVVTIGPATAALYYSMMKVTSDEGTHYVKAFFRSFKQNLKQGIAMGLIFMAVGGLLAYATWFYLQQGDSTGWNIVKGVSIAACVLYLFTLQYAFPLLAKFDNTVGSLIKSAFFMSIRHVGWSIVMIFILAAELFVGFYLVFIPILIPGYGLVVYLDCYILNHVLKPYIKAAGGDTGDEEDPDAWAVPEEEIPEAEETAITEAEETAAAEAEEAAVTEAEETAAAEAGEASETEADNINSGS